MAAYGTFVTCSGIQPISATPPITTVITANADRAVLLPKRTSRIPFSVWLFRPLVKGDAEAKLRPDTVSHVYDHEVDDNKHVFLQAAC
jgi:hypothetical protein